MKDVMLDLETFGNGKHAAICQIGVCVFDRLTGEISATFKSNVDARTGGGDLDADTVYWWLKQGRDAVDSLLQAPQEKITDALQGLNSFLNSIGAEHETIHLWSHATFDFVILSEAYKRLKIEPAFRYSWARDIRTLVDLAGVDPKTFVREGVHHDALADALHQVKYCVAAFQKLPMLGNET